MSERTMRRNVFSKVATLIAIGLCLSTTAAFAQASRTWVSGVGDDANPCSRTAPCKTFAGAISKTAAGGEINVIDPGGFGAVTITKSITIDGGESFASILAAGTNGIVVNAGANDVVTIRNLSINGFGTGLSGIRFLAGGALHVENVQIFLFTQKGIDFQPAGNALLFVRGCQISDNNNASTGGGILIKPGAASTVTASVEDCKLDRNLFGLRADDRATVAVARTAASGNSSHGFQSVATAATTNLTLESCTASGNAANGILSTGASSTVRISNVMATANNRGLNSISSGLIISLGNNSIVGNAVDGTPTSTVPPI